MTANPSSRARASEPVEDRATLLEALGVAHDVVTMASGTNETMASCILDVDRSALRNLYAD